MKLKKGLQHSSSEPYYDLSEGGYLKPEVMCENTEDANKVIEAVEIVQDFLESCEEQIEGFLQ